MPMKTNAPYTVLKWDDREEWLEIRGRGIGGSDVSALMGLNEYKSPLTLWLEKTGRIDSKNLSDNESVQWGIELEPVIRKKFAAKHPEYAVQIPEGTYCSDDFPWERANLDAELVDRKTGAFGVLEIKTVGERRAEDWRDGPPDYYQTQVIHYLNVTGYTFAWFAVLIGGQKYREYRFNPDNDDRTAVREAVKQFWGMVQRDQMPKLVGKRDEGQALTDYFGDGNGEYVQNIDASALVERYQAICADIKALESEMNRVSNQIKEMIGEARGLSTDIYRVTWSRVERTTTDLKKLAADNPELLQEYQHKKTYDGGLRISELKK